MCAFKAPFTFFIYSLPCALTSLESPQLGNVANLIVKSGVILGCDREKMMMVCTPDYPESYLLSDIFKQLNDDLSFFPPALLLPLRIGKDPSWALLCVLLATNNQGTLQEWGRESSVLKRTFVLGHLHPQVKKLKEGQMVELLWTWCCSYC